MAFKIPFIQTSRWLTGVDSYTILDKKVREFSRGHFASVLIARHNGEEFILKEIFCKRWDQEGNKFPKKVKILNDLKIQKQIANIKKVICNYDGLYNKYNFSFTQFSPASGNKPY